MNSVALHESTEKRSSENQASKGYVEYGATYTKITTWISRKLVCGDIHMQQRQKFTFVT